MADTQQLSKQEDDRPVLSAKPALSAKIASRRAFDDSSVTFATVEDGNTVLRLADRSTMTLVGIARIDQLTLFSGGRRRAIRRII